MSEQQVKAYNEQHQTYADTVLKEQKDWIKSIQLDAMSRLNEEGFPHNRDEEWRYTDTRFLFKDLKEVRIGQDAEVSAEADALSTGSILEDSLKIVFIDGKYSKSHSAGEFPKGLKVASMHDLIMNKDDILEPYLSKLSTQYEQGWAMLNTAFITQGVFIYAEPDAEIAPVVEVVHINTGENKSAVQMLRHVIVADKGSKLSVLERYVGNHDNDTLGNVVSELYCEDNADLTRYILQEDGDKSTQFHHSYLRQGANAHIHNFTLSLSGRLLRNEFYGQILGEDSECKMYGIYAPNHRQHIDNCTQIEHMVPRCVSDELYKGVLDDYGRSVFRGRIYVAQDAQQTDAYQTNRNLILSPNAEADTKPQLEIYADDVKCSHGATIGQLDNQQLFYLRSRGLEESEARKLLIYAFVGEVLDSIENAAIKSYVEDALHEQLKKGNMFAKA